MTQELIKALTEAIVKMRRPALIAIGLTLAAYLVMLLVIRGLEVEGRGNRLSGLFVGLGGRSLIHLSTVWLKFAFFTAVLTANQPANQECYILLLALALLAALLSANRLGIWATELISAALSVAGVWTSATLLNYLREISNDREVRAAYWALAAFLILCSAAILLRAIVYISGERNYFDENGEVE